MTINKRISEGISMYTCDTNMSQIIKLMMNPIEYLKGLKSSNHFIIVKKIFVNEFEFNMYIQYLADILVQGYYNYSKYPDCVHRTIYRVMGESEISNLTNGNDINSLFSACKQYNHALDYLLDNFKDVNDNPHYIIELSLKGHIPYVDVDFDAKNDFEEGEIILLPKIKLSNLDISNETYIYKTLYYGKADIVYEDIYEEISIEEIMYIYDELIKYIRGYGYLVSRYLNGYEGNEIFDDTNFISWLNNMSKYIYLVNMYIKKLVIKQNKTDIDLSKIKRM